MRCPGRGDVVALMIVAFSTTAAGESEVMSRDSGPCSESSVWEGSGRQEVLCVAVGLGVFPRPRSVRGI